MPSAPKGKAVYARRDLRGRCAAYARALKLNWMGLLPLLAGSDAAGLRAAGIPAWLYSTPGGDGTPNSSWRVHEYQATIRNFEHLCVAHGLRGYIADIEPKLSDEVNWKTVTDAQVETLAGELLASKQRSGLSIGVTMFYQQRLWRRLGPLVGDEIWISLQMYEPRPKAHNKAIIAEMRNVGWTTCDIPSIASYRHLQGQEDIDAGPGEDVRYLTPSEFTQYVSQFPSLRGAIVWYPIPAPEGALAEAIKRWRPTPWWRLHSNLLLGAVGALGVGAAGAGLARR